MWPKRNLRIMITLALAGLISSCAHTRIDKRGIQHITGFVHLQIPAPNPQQVGVDAIHVTSLGLTLVQSRWTNELVIGYSDSTLGQVGPDSCLYISQRNELFPGIVNTKEEGNFYAP